MEIIYLAAVACSGNIHPTFSLHFNSNLKTNSETKIIYMYIYITVYIYIYMRHFLFTCVKENSK